MARLVPPGAVEHFVELAEGPVRVLVGGPTDAATIPAVLIRGGGTDNVGISWFHAFSALGADRRVIALDLPSFGGTMDVPPVGGPAPMSDLVVRVVDGLGLGTAALGVSMGGDVALNVALGQPDRPAALVLVAPGGLAERVGGRTTHFLSCSVRSCPTGFCSRWRASRTASPVRC
jgi:pimeloyl-ACP methyl ester carboxylesterase